MEREVERDLISGPRPDLSSSTPNSSHSSSTYGQRRPGKAGLGIAFVMKSPVAVFFDTQYGKSG